MESICQCCSGAISKTLFNLMQAYNNEINSSERYAVYSEKAKQDGYESIAAFFMAASIAEKIHAARHAKVAMLIGQRPKAEVRHYSGKDVLQMLKDVLTDEKNELSNLYPQFIKDAEADGQKSAVVSFEGAMKSEMEHARLCQLAIDHFDTWADRKINFYVCSMCGWTKEDTLPAECSICSNHDTNFIEF